MLRIPCVLAMISLAPGLTHAEPVIHHELRVTLTPDSGHISVTDVIHLPPATDGKARVWTLDLHPDLKLTHADPPLRTSPDMAAAGLARYALDATPRDTITLSYEGKIDHPLQELGSGLGQSLEATRGFISTDGVYLDGNSYWYPQLGDQRLSFSLEVQLPAGWSAISQGARLAQAADAQGSRVSWQESHPQQEIYLIANRYHTYQRSAGAVETLVLLRQADAVLAQAYLAAMAEYIALYSDMFGPYPYAKFALVENTWESGYGMPSFTLLGPQVIRLPFIRYTSLPHEILHNWWGNGVYVDYSTGNWSEGLTAYLADHLLKEQRGEGADYRRDVLLRYTNYVAAERDFPLTEFRARHSGASQAIGYGKALMVFHALRLQLGDARFITALRDFYREKQFQNAGWRDLQTAFEKQAGTSLNSFFEQALQRIGAPALRIAAARAVTGQSEGYLLELSIEQTQAGPPFQLNLPIAITLEGRGEALQRSITVDAKHSLVKLSLPARPWRVEVDPDFDVFRRLAPEELPPTLSEALAADRLTIVLPAAASPALRERYRQLARAWASSNEGINVVWDDKLKALPADRALWLFGWENRFHAQLRDALANAGVHFSDTGVQFAGEDLQRHEHAVVLSARRNAMPLLWLGCENPAAFAGLARKLPHYGNASYLGFRGDAPTNFLKGQWQVMDSPLNAAVTQADGTAVPTHTAPHPARPALIAPFISSKE